MSFPHFFWLAVILAVTNSAVGAERMDGTKWKAKVTPDRESADKGAEAFDDEFIFADGQFTSKAMQAHGFKPGPYRLESELDEVEWIALKEATTGDTAGWGGRVDDKTTSGDFHWQKKGGPFFFYKFTAKKE